MTAAKSRVRGDADRAGKSKWRLLCDFGEEFRWTVSGRKGWLLGMAINLVVAVVVVRRTSYDPHKTGEVANAVLGISVVLYVLAGTVNTNQLGADGERVATALEGGDSARRFLLSKNLVLVVLLVPVAILYFSAFGPVRSVWYPVCYLTNGAVVWVLGLWFAAFYDRRHRPRLVRELRRAE